MKSIRKGFMWFFMLNKRLYKKPSFIVIIALVACLAALLGVVSRKDTDILRIAVYAKEPLPDELLNEMNDTDSIISFTFFDSKEQAVEQATKQSMDSVWVFEKDIYTASVQFIREQKPIVTVIQPEDTVFLRLAREKLFATIYPYVSRAFYHEYMQDNFQNPDTAVLDKFFDERDSDRKIIDIRYSNSDSPVELTNYIASPIRGLLAIAVFLCAYAALMGFKQDEKRGMFARIKREKMVFVSLACVFIATLNAGLLTLVSVKLCGIDTELLKEAGLMFMYVIMCTLFCTLIGEFTSKTNALAAIMPVVVIVMLVLCPVFISFNNPIQKLLPTYYYLQSFGRNTVLIKSFIYTGALALACGLIGVCKRLLKK